MTARNDQVNVNRVREGLFMLVNTLTLDDSERKALLDAADELERLAGIINRARAKLLLKQSLDSFEEQLMKILDELTKHQTSSTTRWDGKRTCVRPGCGNRVLESEILWEPERPHQGIIRGYCSQECLDNRDEKLGEMVVIEGEEAGRILDYLEHPENRDPDMERERLSMIEEARRKFPHPEQPSTIAIDLPDDPEEENERGEAK